MFTLLAALLMSPAIAQSTDEPAADNSDKPGIEFEYLEYDYGTIKKGSDGKCVFEFENTGESNLILTNVKSSCGCTVPKWPRQPIEPGGKAEIKVRYNTSKAGSFSKSITFYSNAPDNPVYLRIKGKVVN
jgi:hypothetical protein